ncbi:MAG: hypothetical protein H6974_12845 [Gammaproteobacteria bacterium]|nr:hypothetical protein [Gammaproteobacteria bacterium]
MPIRTKLDDINQANLSGLSQRLDALHQKAQAGLKVPSAASPTGTSSQNGSGQVLEQIIDELQRAQRSST